MKVLFRFFIFFVLTGLLEALFGCYPNRSLVVLGDQTTRTFRSPDGYSETSVMFTDGKGEFPQPEGFYIIRSNDSSNRIAAKLKERYNLGKGWGCEAFGRVYSDFFHRYKGKVYLWEGDQLPLSRLKPFQIEKKIDVYFFRGKERGIEADPFAPEDP